MRPYKHYGECALSIRKMNMSFHNFRNGHIGTSDAERSESSVEITTPEMFYKSMIGNG